MVVGQPSPTLVSEGVQGLAVACGGRRVGMAGSLRFFSGNRRRLSLFAFDSTYNFLKEDGRQDGRRRGEERGGEMEELDSLSAI